MDILNCILWICLFGAFIGFGFIVLCLIFDFINYLTNGKLDQFIDKSIKK